MCRIWVVLLFLLYSCSHNLVRVESNFLKKSSSKELLNTFNDKSSSSDLRVKIHAELYNRNDLNKDSLVNASLYDNDINVSVGAVHEIRGNPTERNLNLLVKVMNETKSQTMVAQICYAFMEINSQQPIPSLINKLSSEDSVIIFYCLMALGKIGNEAQIPILEQFLSNNEVISPECTSMWLGCRCLYPSIGERAKYSIGNIKERIANH